MHALVEKHQSYDTVDFRGDGARLDAQRFQDGPFDLVAVVDKPLERFLNDRKAEAELARGLVHRSARGDGLPSSEGLRHLERPSL
jgi:hypothetical protein